MSDTDLEVPAVTPMGGDGELGFVVWPAYVGACTSDPGPGPVVLGEPDDPNYARGQIFWHDENGVITGRALIKVVKTSPLLPYSHLVYCSGPDGATMSGKVQLPHPIGFLEDGIFEVYPITNPDLQANKRQGIDF